MNITFSKKLAGIAGGLSSLVCVSLASASDRPNVVMISVDDLNDWVGVLKGHPKAITPNLDRLMEKSTYFTNAHCNAPVCSASRNSLLTGLRPTTTGWYSNADSGKRYKDVLNGHPVMPLHFRNNGYYTMAAGKVYHKGVADYLKEEQWDEYRKHIELSDEITAQGQGYGDKGAGEYFYPFPKGGGQFFKKYGKSNGSISLCWSALERNEMPGGKMPDEHFADWAVEKLNAKYDKPFFMALGFVRPHVPYTAPKEYFDLYDIDEIELEPALPGEMSDIPLYGKAMAFSGGMKHGDHIGVESMGPNFRKELTHAYLACVSMVDAQVGKVLDALEKSGKSDNTIVLLWSDHGQNMGEKYIYRKMCLWEESTRVPFSIYAPGITKGALSPRTVTLLDMYPTLVELCGLPKLSELEGDSLVSLIKNPMQKWDKVALTSWMYKNHSVRTARWRYIRYRDGEEELYDHRFDPGEHNNVAGLEKNFKVIKQLRKHLPEKESVPANVGEFKTDLLEQTIQAWENNGGIPEYLK